MKRLPPFWIWSPQDFQIDPSRPLYEQFVEQIRAKIAMGKLEPGARLPSVRDTAASLRVNPTTVMKAYQELERLSLIVTFRGQGTFVTRDTDAIRSSRKRIAKEAFRQLEETAASIGLTVKELIELAHEQEE